MDVRRSDERSPGSVLLSQRVPLTAASSSFHPSGSVALFVAGLPNMRQPLRCAPRVAFGELQVVPLPCEGRGETADDGDGAGGSREKDQCDALLPVVGGRERLECVSSILERVDT